MMAAVGVSNRVVSLGIAGLVSAPAVYGEHQATPAVLVVEPDDGLRDEVVAELRAMGLTVEEARDGLGALLALSHRSPDLVVLDVDLAQVSGYRVFQVLRGDSRTRHARVVMLAHGAMQEVLPSPNEGPLPECFLQKPVAADTVVRELVRTAETVTLGHG